MTLAAILLLVLAALVLCFGFVVFYGAPYLPTLTPQVAAALDLADVQPGQTLLELGCGDGKVLIAAAERGCTAIGYELNPILAAVAWLRTRRYRGRVRIVCGNFWHAQLPPAEVIFVFLLDRYMSRLDTKIIQSMPKPVKLVSFAFQIPGRTPTSTRHGVYLYTYREATEPGLHGGSESDTISSMKQSTAANRRGRSDQRGQVSVLLIPFILTVLLFIGAAGFGMWAFSGREDYRLNTEQKIADAVKQAKIDEGIVKDKEHAEADKQPLKLYTGPEQFGSVQVAFPKSWSGYVDDNNSSNPISGYFHPGTVPSVTDQKSVFALRVQVIDRAYSEVLNGFANNKTGITTVPYAFPKVPKTVGVRIDGKIDQSKQATGAMVIVPLRDKTLQVFTESPLYLADFNNNILPNLSFSP